MATQSPKQSMQTTDISSSPTKHTSAIVGGVIGIVFITAIVGVFYIRRRSRKRNGTLGSSLESQPPPPLPSKPTPVKLTPDPYTLKYIESQRDVNASERESSTNPVNPLMSDRKIDELIRRMRTLEMLLVESPGVPPPATPLPPNYTNTSRIV
ncbi:hypothetical protein EV368DRAFT_87810 [Lentinula lateritia]|nr:hypothetical protein EV368DRAFT_87810 [Lentinula lateritia]